MRSQTACIDVIVTESASAIAGVEEPRLLRYWILEQRRSDFIRRSVQYATEIRRLLPILAKVPYRLPEVIAREAAGLEPVPTAKRVIEFLKRASFSDVMIWPAILSASIAAEPSRSTE